MLNFTAHPGALTCTHPSHARKSLGSSSSSLPQRCSPLAMMSLGAKPPEQPQQHNHGRKQEDLGSKAAGPASKPADPPRNGPWGCKEGDTRLSPSYRKL